MRTVRGAYVRRDGTARSYEHNYVQVQAAITPRTKERLKAQARKEGKTMAALVRNYVQRGLSSL